MRTRVMWLLCAAAGLACASVCFAQPPGQAPPAGAATDVPGAAAGPQLRLTVRTSLTDPKPETTTLVALSDETPAPLTETEAASADSALKQLFAACGQYEDVPAILMAAAPDRALQHFAAILLSASDDAKRGMAAEAAKLEGPEAESIVARVLMTGVGWHAKRALDARHKPVPVDALFVAFQGAAPEPIVESLQYIGAKGDESLIAPLRTLTTHPAPTVRAKALARLAVIGTPAILGDFRGALGDAFADVRRQALEGLQAQGALTDQDLVAALQGAGETLKSAVLELMPATTDPVLVRFATEASTAQDSKLWPLALKAAARNGNPDLIPKLLGLLSSERKEVRACAVAALGAHPGVTDFAPVVQLAKDDAESDVCTAAANALASAGPPGLAAGLAGLAPTDKGWAAFVSAVVALGGPAADAILAIAKIPTVPLGEEFGKACETVPPPTRYALAALILERGDGRGQAKAIAALQADASPEAQAALLAACDYPNSLPEKVVDVTSDVEFGGGYMVVGSRDIDGRIWQMLLDALGGPAKGDAESGKQRLLRVALAGLASTEASVRAGALRALADLAPEEQTTTVREAVVRFAADPDAGVRRAAAAAAAALGHDDLWPVVQSLLGDGEWRVRRAAIDAIARYLPHIDAFAEAMRRTGGHTAEEEYVGLLTSLPTAQAATALRALVALEGADDLSVKAIAALWAFAASGTLTSGQFEEALAPAIGGKNAERELAALCALASHGSPNSLSRLLELAVGRPQGLRQFSVGADYAGQSGQGIIAADRVRVVARLGFARGHKSNGFFSTTYLLNLPVPASRRADQFGPGDRWPLDLTQAVTGEVNPALIAAARYSDPRVDELISAAAAQTDAAQRRSAVWAMALRDDREGIERMLGGANADVAQDAVRALRLLGHRASVPALAPWVSSNLEAAKAVVEVTLLRDTP